MQPYEACLIYVLVGFPFPGANKPRPQYSSSSPSNLQSGSMKMCRSWRGTGLVTSCSVVLASIRALRTRNRWIWSACNGPRWRSDLYSLPSEQFLSEALAPNLEHIILSTETLKLEWTKNSLPCVHDTRQMMSRLCFCHFKIEQSWLSQPLFVSLPEPSI